MGGLLDVRGLSRNPAEVVVSNELVKSLVGPPARVQAVTA
jgi:hypothetical protein